MKRALVVSGGGSKGAFAIGVIKRLFDEFPELEFDIFVGTSTGSLIVPFIAMDELDFLEKMYTSVHTDDIVHSTRLGDDVFNNTSIFDVAPLEQLVVNNYTDARYDQLMASGKPVFLNSVCLQNGELVVFTTADDP